jgi:hypothetical protein
VSKWWKASLRILTFLDLGSWGLSSENSFEKIVKTFQNGEKDPWGSSLHWTCGCWGSSDKKTALINVEKVSKWRKASLRILTFLDLGVLGIVSGKLLWKMWKKCQNGQKEPWGSSLRWTCGSWGSLDKKLHT